MAALKMTRIYPTSRNTAITKFQGKNIEPRSQVGITVGTFKAGTTVHKYTFHQFL